MADQAANELLSTQKASDLGLQVVLHPLPILEISDFIVRGYQRGFQGAVVGALLGQQHGRNITIEHSFSCKAAKNNDGFYELDEPWFRQRLEQMRLVHKSPQLDLVGWYSLVPKTGPTAQHLPIHRQISTYNEAAVLLGFHVEEVLDQTSTAVPITIYESNLEPADGHPATSTTEDHDMKDAETAANLVLRFRKLQYTTDAGEAEMIAVQHIRGSGGGAAAVTADVAEKNIVEQFDKKIAVDDGKGKRRAVAYQDPCTPKQEGAAASTSAAPANEDSNLSPAESEYMAALQAKANAVRALKSRLDLFIAYLQRLPPDFVSGAQTTSDAAAFARASTGQFTIPSNNILRRIQALVTNAGLAAAPEHDDPVDAQISSLSREIQRETNDVRLVSLAADLLASVVEMRDACKKALVLDSARHQRVGPRRAAAAAAAMAGLAGVPYDSALRAAGDLEGVNDGAGPSSYVI
ncbi:hypothetical protein VTJ83DRAFT_4206 [Remersonia thermophila]|uniref:COP9 signalosome complex subunit 6 n=1 Tax=Remersonia thermophila TaxID=72144 RepID=A0ABR4DA69_9PEZI